MSKYFKTFEEVKIAITLSDGSNQKEFYDVVVNDRDKADDFSRHSAYGRNPLDNVMKYQDRHDHMSFDDFLDILVCHIERRKNQKKQ